MIANAERAIEISKNTREFGHDGPFCTQCAAEGGLDALRWPEVRKLADTLIKIQGMAGHPDAAQACRNIIRECATTLSNWKALSP